MTWIFIAYILVAMVGSYFTLFQEYHQVTTSDLIVILFFSCLFFPLIIPSLLKHLKEIQSR